MRASRIRGIHDSSGTLIFLNRALDIRAIEHMLASQAFAGISCFRESTPLQNGHLVSGEVLHRVSGRLYCWNDLDALSLTSEKVRFLLDTGPIQSESNPVILHNLLNGYLDHLSFSPSYYDEAVRRAIRFSRALQFAIF